MQLDIERLQQENKKITSDVEILKQDNGVMKK